MRMLIVWAAIVAAPLRLGAQTPAVANVDQPLQVEIARVQARAMAIQFDDRFQLVCRERSLVREPDDDADPFSVAKRNDYPATEVRRH